jgi:hypothetical protein
MINGTWLTEIAAQKYLDSGSEVKQIEYEDHLAIDP